MQIDIGCDSDADLPNGRLQHEVACVAIQSRRVVLKLGIFKRVDVRRHF